MRDFSWKYFTMTGDVESYLLFKEIDNQMKVEEEDDDETMPDDPDGYN